jgi:hypothetical protein
MHTSPVQQWRVSAARCWTEHAHPHNDQAAEVGRDNGAAADSQRNHLGGGGRECSEVSQLLTPIMQQPRARRTAIQAKFSDISPEATGRKGLLILSMLIS